VFFGGRLFESHPLTIITAPPSISCLSNIYSPGITLGARAVGDWTRALNEFALQKGRLDSKVLSAEKAKDIDQPIFPPIHARVMMDGPYGGCSLDLGRYETVLLIAGGSGVTFTLAMLDDIVGRCVRLGRPHGERTRRIEFAWCVKSFGK
jgi:predicted ferric reductase